MRETVRRALRTFVQAAIGWAAANFAASAIGIIKGGDVLVAFIASAVASGIAAVMNLPKKEKEKKEREDNDG